MGDAKRTVLKHEDSSKETWDTPKVKVKRRLRERVKTKNLGIEYKTDSIGTFRVGLKPTKGPHRSPSHHPKGSGASAGKKRVGVGLTFKF